MFGFIEDLLYKIPTPKLKIPQKADKFLRFLKYIVLAVFVIGLPTFLVNEYGTSAPYFCKLICPVGTLEDSIPLVLLNESLRKTVGFLFHWKFGVLIFMYCLPFSYTNRFANTFVSLVHSIHCSTRSAL